MEIGVISDTHLAGHGTGLPSQVFDVFKNMDLILHCGDLECIGVLDELEKIAPVKAVRGYEDPIEAGSRLSDRVRLIKTGKIRIAMVHDIQWPYPPIYTTADGQSILLPEDYENTAAMLHKKFGCVSDVVLFGDTHEELVLWKHGILWMNPGSPTFPGKHHLPNDLATVGVIKITGTEIDACIIDLKDIPR